MTKPQTRITTDFVLLAPDATLRQVAGSARRGAGIAVITTRDARYVAIDVMVLVDLADMLERALNRGLAEELLDAPLGDVLARLAYPGLAEGAARAGWAQNPDACFIVLSAGKVAGVIGRPVAGASTELLDRLGVDAQALDQAPAKALPPLFGESALEPQEAAESAEPAESLPLPEVAPEEPSGSDPGALPEPELEREAEPPPAPRPTPSRRPSPPSPPSPAKPGAQESREEVDALGAGGRIKERIRLDVATPEAAVVGTSFDVAVAVRQPTSAQLKVDDLGKVTSAEGAVFRPASDAVVRYRVELEARDCEVDPPSYEFLLEPGQDSIVQFFQVTPQRAGKISLRVNAYQANDNVLAASTRVQLTATVEVTQPPPDAPLPSGATPLALTLYGVMGGSQCSLDDLQHIAFLANVDWDNLPGDTKRAKARALIQDCERRGDIDKLRSALLDARPDVKL